METITSFGDWLRRRRKALDLTQDALAGQIGCSVGLIRKIESDERRPSHQIAELLGNALQIPANDHQKFIQIARGQLRTERLASIELRPVALPTSAARSVTLPAQTAPLQPNPNDATPTQPPTPPLSSLPVPPTPFIGRTAEMRELNHLLANPACRLLSIVGLGGIGKTRLALTLAAQQQPKMADGVTFVALAPLAAAEFMVTAMANALGFSFAGTTEPTVQLCNYLSKRQILLVLDNIEHLLDGVDLLAEILERAAGVKILVTSRERLNLQGEWVFDLQGLPVPPERQTDQLTGYNVVGYAAVALFVEGAQRVSRDFKLSAQNQNTVIRICQLVEGVPLAIELAAAWVHLLSCHEIVQEIERSIDFLTVNRRDLPERHRSLRAVFDHSWRLLTDNERGVLCRLALFRNGFRREAAAAVANATVSFLATLSTKSLLRRSQEGRYELHELVRQYALERLQTMGEWEATCDQHLAYFLQLVKEANEQLRGPNLVDWYNRLEQEHANLRAALSWAFAPNSTPARIERGLRLAASNHRYWQGRGHLREGFTWLEQGLQRHPAVDAATRANALQIAGWLVHQLGDGVLATAMLQESITLYRQLNDEQNQAAVLDFLGDVAWMRGDFATAQSSYAASLTILRRRGAPYSIGLSLYSAGRLHVDYAYYTEAAGLLQEGLALLEGIPHARGIALCLNALGRLALLQGKLPVAGGHLRKALQLFYELGNKVDIAECLEALALTSVSNHQERAITLWSAAHILRQHLGVLQSDHDPLNQQALRMGIQTSIATTAWAQGQSMPLAEAVALALTGEDGFPPHTLPSL